MLTARGWVVAVTAVGLWVAGRILGASPLEQLAVGLITLVVASVVVVRRGNQDVEVVREISPSHAQPRQPVTLSMEIHNKGSRPAPLLLLEDRLPPGLSGTPRLGLHGVEPGGSRRGRLTIKASRRGRYWIGPIDVFFVDPFGLAHVRTRVESKDKLVVYPNMEKLSLPRDTAERRSIAVSSLRQPTGAQGEDFYTLREYGDGDDLRKVHWPSTAKRGKYMLRQEETPWHSGVTVVVDDTTPDHGFVTSSSFERAVEAAASVVDLYDRHRFSYRVTAAHDPGLPSGRGEEHRRACLDVLATIAPRDTGSDEALLFRLSAIQSARGAEAALVLVTGTVSARVALALAACRRRFRQVTAISFPAHRFGRDSTRSRWEGESQVVESTRLLTRSGVRVIVLGPDDPLAPSWVEPARTASKEMTWGRRPELV